MVNFMKKVITLVVSLALMMSISTTAFAEDLSAGNGETEIKTHVYSHYNISIPAVIDLRNGESGQVTISDANIESNYSVNVYVTNTEDFGGILLKHSNGMETINCSFMNIETNMLANGENPLVSFNDSDIEQGTATKYFEIQADTYGTPGDYTGTMQYSFECQPNN